MVNQIGRQCYHCLSFKSIFQKKKDGKEYLKCGGCGKPFIYYPQNIRYPATTKRQTAVAKIAKENKNVESSKLSENPDVPTG